MKHSSIHLNESNRLLVIILLATFSLNSFAHVFTKVRYVKIDHHQHTAYMYDQNFKQLPDSLFVAKTSMDIIPATIWLLGFKVDVIKRLGDHKVKVVSNDPTL